MATDSEMAVPSSRIRTGTRRIGLMAVKAGVRTPACKSTSSKGTVIPFSARKMRTRRGLGAVCVSMMCMAGGVRGKTGWRPYRDRRLTTMRTKAACLGAGSPLQRIYCENS
jgi:hypothetical protein